MKFLPCLHICNYYQLIVYSHNSGRRIKAVYFLCLPFHNLHGHLAVVFLLPLHNNLCGHLAVFLLLPLNDNLCGHLAVFLHPQLHITTRGECCCPPCRHHQFAILLPHERSAAIAAWEGHCQCHARGVRSPHHEKSEAIERKMLWSTPRWCGGPRLRGVPRTLIECKVPWMPMECRSQRAESTVRQGSNEWHT